MSDRISRRSWRDVVMEQLESRTFLSVYYVSPGGSDGANGTTSASAWRTLQRAADAVAAGDTVHVLPGTYTAGMNLFGKPGGTAASPIRFLAQPGAVLTHCATSGTNASLAGINLENAGGWWVIQGFTVLSDGSMQRAGIRVANTDHVRLLDNTVRDAFIGIFASNTAGTLIQGNTCRDSTDQHGIYLSLNTTGCVVRGNVLAGNNWDGLHLNALLGSPNDGALVEGNVIYANHLSGMDVEGVTNATFRNNLIYGNGKHGITIHSQDQANTPPSRDCTFANNTITGNEMFAVQVKPQDTQGQVFVNNVLLTRGNTYGSIGTSGLPVGLVSDHNVVMDSFSTTLGTTRLTLAQWRAATGQDGHSVIATPSQVSADAAAGDYRLRAGSPAIDIGVATLAGRDAPTADLLGLARPQGAGWDAGALEHR